MKEPLKLRAHHGMCLAFFEGKGYSSAFTENMGKVLEEMEIEAGKRKDICGDCSWTEICSRKEQIENGCAGTPEQK